MTTERLRIFLLAGLDIEANRRYAAATQVFLGLGSAEVHREARGRQDLMHSFDYSVFMRDPASDLDRAKAISDGVNFLAAVEKPLNPTSNVVGMSGYEYSVVAEPSPLVYNAPGDGGIHHRDVFITEAMLLRSAVVC